MIIPFVTKFNVYPGAIIFSDFLGTKTYDLFCLWSSKLKIRNLLIYQIAFGKLKKTSFFSDKNCTKIAGLTPSSKFLFLSLIWAGGSDLTTRKIICSTNSNVEFFKLDFWIITLNVTLRLISIAKKTFVIW